MKKILGLICLVLGFLFIGFGTVSYFASDATGDVVLKSGVIELNVTGYDEITKSYTLKEDGDVMPGDSGEFTISIDVANSTSDVYCYLTFDKEVVPSNLNFYLDSDHTILINKYFKIFDVSEETSDDLTIYWYWDGTRSDEADSEFIGVDMVATFSLNALQLEKAYMKNGSNAKDAFWADSYRDKIKTVTFVSSTSGVPSICTSENLCFDITADGSERKVYAYLSDSGTVDLNGNVLYDLKICANAFIFAPSDLSYFFSDFTNLVSVDLNSLVTLNTTDMSYMFNNCTSLVELDLTSLCTDRVNDMQYMFNNCTSLKSINLESFNTNRVLYMQSMFKNNSSLINLDISHFVSNRVVNVNGMFYGTSSLELLDMRNFVFENEVATNNENYINLFLNSNSNPKVIVKNSQEQAFVLGLGSSSRPGSWNKNNVVLY